MNRHLAAVLAVCAAALLLIAQAQAGPEESRQPAADDRDAKSKIEDAVIQQERLKRQFDELAQSLLRLAQRLESSDKQADKDRAAAIRKAMARAQEQNINRKFDDLIEGLRKDSLLNNLPELEKLLAQNKEVRDELRALLDGIINGRRDLRQEIVDLERLLEAIKKALDKQLKAHAQTVGDRVNLPTVLEVQRNTTKQTAKIFELRPDEPIKKHIEAANRFQKAAEDYLEEARRSQGATTQEKAIAELQKAKKKLEELLAQKRNEEAERFLAALLARCERMLALQIIVRDGTVDLDKVIGALAGKKASRAQEQQSLELSDKEDEIAKQALAALALVEAEGSAVAFAEVFRQVHADMETVAARLRRTDTGTVTVTIENDIIATLREMIEALKKSIADMDGPRPPKPPRPPEKPRDPPLIDPIAELKMIRALQVRINARTEVYGNQYRGEQAPPPDSARDSKEREQYEAIQKELKDLAGRQKKISRMAHDIATAKNEVRID
jgi:hypothetical protein